MPKEVVISPEVRDVLERSEAVGPVLKLPQGQLDRPLYEAVDKVLKALGGRWSRRDGGHVFAKGIDGPLAEALAAGRAVDHKRTLEQFWTPPEIVRQMCDQAGDLDMVDVLEPSAGNGCILFEIIGRGGFPTVVEIDAEQASQLVAETEGRVPVFAEDFMLWSPGPPQTPGSFEVVLMNPPFSNCQDIRHVSRALGFVRLGGRLVAVMSPHWTFAEDKESRQFRDLLRRFNHVWRALPPGSFKGSDTGVNAGLLTIWKGERP